MSTDIFVQIFQGSDQNDDSQRSKDIWSTSWDGDRLNTLQDTDNLRFDKFWWCMRVNQEIDVGDLTELLNEVLGQESDEVVLACTDRIVGEFHVKLSREDLSS